MRRLAVLPSSFNSLQLSSRSDTSSTSVHSCLPAKQPFVMANAAEHTPPRTPAGGETLEKNPEKPLHELLTNKLVEIYVGPEGVVYSLHEKLLCYYSTELRNHFYNSSTSNTSYGLPDDDTVPFDLLVGWLYSRTLSFPVSETEIGPLLDLYLLAERLQMSALEADCVDTVRAYYHANESYPELRRVQYVYSNTSDDNPLREMMVGSVARYLTLGEDIPSHWDKALRRNGQLAVDIIRSIQQWHLEGRSVPDARDGSVRGFSKLGSDDAESDLDLTESKFAGSRYGDASQMGDDTLDVEDK